jgi:hypothetical protein
MRRVVFVTVIVLGLLGAAAGCARASTGPPTPPPSSPAPPTDRAQIYAAMLRRFVAGSGEGVGAGPPTAVYVLDVAASDAGPYRNMAGQPATYPIPVADQVAILAVMRGASGTPVSFVASGTEVPDSGNGCLDAGVLVTLGPAPTTVATGTDRLEVGINGTTACLGFVGTTYTVERRPDGWVSVEPETVTMSIS